MVAGTETEVAPAATVNCPMDGWSAGCTAIWSSLFTVGNFLYGRMGLAMLLLGVFIASGLLSVAWDAFAFAIPLYGSSIGLSASVIGASLMLARRRRIRCRRSTLSWRPS